MNNSKTPINATQNRHANSFGFIPKSRHERRGLGLRSTYKPKKQKQPPNYEAESMLLIFAILSALSILIANLLP